MRSPPGLTQTQVRAACVDYCRQQLQRKASARAILCNAGQANAATGEGGWEDVRESAQLLSQSLGIPGDAVLLASTGVIGQRIKMDALRDGVPKIVSQLSHSGGDEAAAAIITTDLVTKSIALEAQFGDRTVRMGGICKGSGMIHPNMATMLALLPVMPWSPRNCGRRCSLGRWIRALIKLPSMGIPAPMIR